TIARSCAPRARAGDAPGSDGRRDLYLSHASGSAADRPGPLSEVRHGAGTGVAERRGGRWRRAASTHAPLPGLGCAHDPGVRVGHGAASVRLAMAIALEHRRGLDRSRAGDDRGAVGRCVVLRAWLAIAQALVAQHVYPDRVG